MKVYYGLTNWSQLKRLPKDLSIMVSARWLMKVPLESVVYKYLAEYESVFLDSGAFGSAFYDGGFTYTVDEYATLVEKIRPEYWAAMDYPCEPSIRHGLTVGERICLTVQNTLLLASKDIPGFVPVIQGWIPQDYLSCVDALEAEGLIMPMMGIGSICRRGRREPIVAIIQHLHERLPKVKFHAFGVKISALKYNNGEILNYLDSIDTAAWQFNEKDELGGWKPRNLQELASRLDGYKAKLEKRLQSPYQLILSQSDGLAKELPK